MLNLYNTSVIMNAAVGTQPFKGILGVPPRVRMSTAVPTSGCAMTRIGERSRKLKQNYKVVCMASPGTPVGGTASGGLNPREFGEAVRQQNDSRGQGNQDNFRRQSNGRRSEHRDWDNGGNDDDVEPQGGWRVFVSLGTFIAGFFLVWKVKSQTWPSELSLAVLLITWAALRVGNFLEVVVRTQTPFLRRAVDRDLGRTSSSGALAAEWGLWGASVALMVVTKHALTPWWVTVGLLGASLAVDSLFLQVGLNRRAEAVIARELKEETLTDEQREELRALKRRAQEQGDEPSSTYSIKILLDSFRAIITAVWAYRICDRLAIIARIAAGV
eukprot:jgi/Botrbrau1/1218/Bobra.0163s0026.1